MDFHTLLRRDLQFLCKRNKIQANMTNVAMADALKALETVEGLDEIMNESDSKAPQSQTTVAKRPPRRTASEATRRSARLLEKSMANLVLETKETLGKQEKKEDTKQKVSSEAIKTLCEEEPEMNNNDQKEPKNVTLRV